MKPTHISGVFLMSADPARLSAFYRDVLNFSLTCDHVDGEIRHYECDFGQVHFAIHPPRGSVMLQPSDSVSFSLAVTSLDEYLLQLRRHGVQTAFGPFELDFGRLAGIRDPDGNLVQLTELRA